MVVYLGNHSQSPQDIASMDVIRIKTGVTTYWRDVGHPPDLNVGLNALLKNVDNSEKWNGPYIKKKPIDPWGKEYQYIKENTTFRICSLGPDGIPSVDDISF